MNHRMDDDKRTCLSSKYLFPCVCGQLGQNGGHAHVRVLGYEREEEEEGEGLAEETARGITHTSRYSGRVMLKWVNRQLRIHAAPSDHED